MIETTVGDLLDAPADCLGLRLEGGTHERH